MGNITLAIYSLTLAGTVLATCLIIFQILRMGKTADTSPYRKVIELVVESSALYSLSVIFVLPFWVGAVDTVKAYPLRFVQVINGAMVVRTFYECIAGSDL
jgi:hypothetical protein